ncbi:dTDP-4-dehydrorhamnose 3,5-epimerase family protein [bacterium]|nr:dTDP-4-dehydrorhamnose 3,5-epimerase family protein [bacterium]
MIEGVTTKKLSVIPDERGRLMEILRVDDDQFERFGQVYMTTTYPGVIKAWHYHKLQDDNVTVVKGMLKLVLFDDRKDSPTCGEVNEFFLGDHKPLLVHIPHHVYHGWKCISETEAIAVNCVTEAYNYKLPDEHRLDFDSPDVPYDWGIKMG